MINSRRRKARVFTNHVFLALRIPTIDHSVHNTHAVKETNIIQILTGAEVNNEKFCPEVMQCCPRAKGPRVTLHN